MEKIEITEAVIERAAEALYEARRDNYGKGGAWQDIAEDIREGYRRGVRIVLGAVLG